MMMNLVDESSPFDRAAAQPILGEPAKKKFVWSWMKSVSNAVSSSSSRRSDPSRGIRGDQGLNVEYRGYSAPTTSTQEIIIFSEEETALLNRDLELGLQLVDGEQAMWRERHESLSEIHASMQCINEIQKDFASIVREQEASITEMATMSIESLDHATGGLSQLSRIQHELAVSSKRRKQMLAASATLFVVVVLSQYLVRFVANEEEVSPKH